MQAKTNKVVRVNFAGGILGLVFGSHRGKLEVAIGRENADGWNLAECIPDNPNLALVLLRLVLLFLTFGLWTISTGYILVFEKPVNASDTSANATDTSANASDTRVPRPNKRIEPKLTAK